MSEIIYSFLLLPALTEVEEQIDGSILTDPFIQKDFHSTGHLYWCEKMCSKLIGKIMRVICLEPLGQKIFKCTIY
jgi:hypothetical protein